MRIAGCETGMTYSRWATGSAGERGYFQIHPSNAGRALYDPRTGKRVGSIEFSRLYQPWYNTRVAYYMSRGGTSWGEWTCSRMVTLRSVQAAKPSHSDRYLVAQRINRVLAPTPMRGTGFIFERWGFRHRISPYFMVAVAGTESSLGRASCNNNPRNVWGLGSCVNSWPVPYFETWNEAVAFYARFLRGNWPTARTPYDFHGYAACSSCWGSHTAGFMRSLFGVGPEVRYP